MSKATQSKSAAKKQHRRTCKNAQCRSKFTTTDSRKTFCTRECKENSSNTAKRSKTYEIPKTNHFFVYLTKEVVRAGTLHVLDPLHSVEALQALYEVVKGRLIANVLSGTELFNVAHIAPSKHEYVLGLLSAENLLIAPATMNKRHTNIHSNKAGVFMYRADMELGNTILPDDTNILDRIIDYIGIETVISFCKKCKLTPAQRQQALKKLSSLIDTTNPDHRQFVALLSDTTAKTPQIVAAIEAINGFKEFKPMMKGQRLSESAMLIKELIRHAEFRGELEGYAAIARQYTREDFAYIGLSTDAQRCLFNLLHGYLEPEMESEVDCLLYELRAPLRAQSARTAAIEARVQEHAAEAAKRIAHFNSPAVQWEISQFEADFLEHTGYCLIPYMIPTLTLNLTKARHVPESGSTLPSGDVAF